MNSILNNEKDNIERWKLLIEQWILDLVNNGTTKFDQLLLSLPGVSPDVLTEILQRLVTKNSISPVILTDAEEDVSRQGNVPNHFSSHSISLPIPHPLDFEYRFSDATINYLLTSKVCV